MDDAYSTQLTAGETVETSGLEQLNALKEGDAFLVADGWGDMKGGADGLFTEDEGFGRRWTDSCGGELWACFVEPIQRRVEDTVSGHFLTKLQHGQV